MTPPRSRVAPAVPERENGCPIEPPGVPLPTDLRVELRRLLTRLSVEDDKQNPQQNKGVLESTVTSPEGSNPSPENEP